MERRTFFKRILAGAAAAAVASELDPERLLWVPGAKAFFLPPAKRVEAEKLIVEPKDLTIDANAYRDMETGIDWATGKDYTAATYRHGRSLHVTKSAYRGEWFPDCDVVVLDGRREVKGEELAQLLRETQEVLFTRDGRRRGIA